MSGPEETSSMCPPMKSQARLSRRSQALFLAGTMLLGIAAPAITQAQAPYTPGSPEDLILRFSNGPDGSVMSPAAGLSPIISYNNTPVNGTAGGWSLTSQGTVGVGPVVVLGQSRTSTNINNGALRFQMVTSGLSNLVGVSLPSSWRASSTITGSENWGSLPQTYQYNFDVNLSSSILSLNPSLFGQISLSIRSGGNDLYSVTGLEQILGITSITQSSYTNQTVEFNYNPTTGPLELVWSASTTLSTALLSGLGDGTSTIFSVGNTSMTTSAIPEPSTYALAFGIAGMGIFLIRRKRKAIAG